MQSTKCSEWPLYVVASSSTPPFPIPRQDLVLVSWSTEFARLVCNCLAKTCDHRRFTLVRVPPGSHRKPAPVNAKRKNSSAACDQLDHQTSAPSSVLMKMHCHTSDKHGRRGLIDDITVCSDPSATNCSHKDAKLDLNTLTSVWAASSAARDALYSAKLTWLGPLYFARALRGRLPDEILDDIVLTATSQQETRIIPLPRKGLGL